jgi:1-acyl-sn-glycerol-3-phosphate acyltransferase
MIYPKNNRIIFWFLKKYIEHLVGRHFHELLFNEIEVDKNRSILLIANHYSFWDGLILFCINQRLFKKKAHVMILEETIKKEPFLKYAGAFSVSKNSRDILVSINYAAGLLDDPNNLVLIFPQGKLYSNFVDHVNFQKGISKIIKQAKGNFQLIFAAAFVQYFKNLKPTATVYLKNECVDYAAKSTAELQSTYQQFYDESKLLQTEAFIG